MIFFMRSKSCCNENKKLLLILCGFFISTCLTPSSLAAKENHLVLDELLTNVLSSNPAVLIEQSMLRASEEDLNVAQLKLYPALSVQVDSSKSTPMNIMVRHILWDGGAGEARLKAANEGVGVQGAQVEEVQTELGLRLIEAWQSFQQAQGRLETIATTKRHLADYLALMQRRVDAKVSPPIELSLLSARTSQIDTEMQQVTAGAHKARGRINELSGRQHSEDYLKGTYSLNEQVSYIESWLERIPLPSLDNIIEKNPSVIKARHQAEVSRNDATAQRAAQLPEIYLVAQKQFGSSVTINPNARAFYIGLQYSPGAGFATSAQLRAAQERAEGAVFGIDKAQRNLKEIWRNDEQDLISMHVRIVALEASEIATQAVLNSYQRQFVAGRKNWLEVLNAMRENHDIAGSLAEARAALVAAVYRLRLRSGFFIKQYRSY